MNIASELSIIEMQLVEMGRIIDEIRGYRQHLLWFADAESTPYRMLTQRNARTALNHAATLVGYYDGYAARGAFQKRVGAESDARLVRTLQELLDYVHWVLNELLAVIRNLMGRRPLALCKNGPTKPGPPRTIEVCQLHLQGLHRTLLAVVLRATTCKDIERKIQGFLASI